MKGKAAAAGVLLLLVSSALVWAGQPWKEKPANLWTWKDVEKVLNKSPWVRPPVDLAAIPTTNPGASVPDANAQAEWVRIFTVQGQKSQGVPAPGARAEPVITPAGPRPADPHRGVRWLSSSAMQQAVVRARELAGQGEDDGLRQFLALARDCHLISVEDLLWAMIPAPLVVSNMNPQDFEKEVRPTTYLELKPSKKKVFPVSAAFVSTRFTLPSTLYCFPREIEGQPVVSPLETKAKFRWGPKKNGRQVEFNLTKMTRDGKPDL